MDHGWTRRPYYDGGPTRADSAEDLVITGDIPLILLVGDRLKGLADVGSALEDVGATLISAASGEEALRRLLDDEYAVVLAPVSLTDMSGLELAKRIRARERGRPAPVVFVSVGEDFPLEEAYALGAVDHLPAPVAPVILRSKVAMLVELFRRERDGCAVEAASGIVPDDLWKTTLASIGDAVISTDAQGRVSFLNPVAERLTGWPMAEALGRPVAEIFQVVNATTRKPVDNPALQVLETGEVVMLSNHALLIARDGVEWPIDDSAAPIRDGSGAVVGAVLVFRDGTELKAADIVRSRLAAIVESSNDAIVGKDLDGTIRTWNAGAERIFGYTAEEVIGRSITLIVPKDRLSEEWDILDRLRRGERIEHFETKRTRKGGELVDVAVSISPIRDADGRVIGASKIARDVTEAKRAERAVAAALQAGEVGTYYWDIPNDRVTGDRNFVALFGVLPDDRSFAPVADFIAGVHPEDRDRVASEIQRTLNDGTPYRTEYRVIRPDGERWLLARGAVGRDADGRPLDWAGVLVDITARKAIEEALAASLSRLDYAVEAAGLGFWHWDLPLGEIHWDDRVKKHFHLPPNARITTELLYQRLHPDDRRPTRDAIERSITEGTGYDIHYRTVDPATGAEKWVRSIGRASFDESGAPKRFDGVALDVTDQRRAEAAIRESNERFSIVSRATYDAIWDWDMRTDAVWWNEGVTELFGYRREDIGPTASWWYDHIHPEDRDRVVGGIHVVIDGGGGHWTDEYRFRKADGSCAFVLDRGYAIQEDGKTIRLVGAMLDMTEQRRAEQRLRESEQRFRTLFEAMDDGYCVIEPLYDAQGHPVDYRYHLANPALEQHTGLTDVVGKTARQLMPNHERHWIENYARVAETGGLYRDGGWVGDLGRWIDLSAFRIGSPEDRRVGVLFSDITDRKLAEALLREKDERFQLLVDQASDYAMIIADRDGRIMEWSGGAESITGFTADEVLDQPVDLIFTPDDRAAQAPAEERARTVREGRIETGRWLMRRDGNEFFAEGVMVPLRSGDGSLRGFGRVFRDATARRRAEDSMRFLAHAGASLAELVDYSSTLNRIANLAVDGFADWCVVDLVNDNGERERLTVTASETADVKAARSADQDFHPVGDAAGLIPHVLRTGEPEVVSDLFAADSDTAAQGPERMNRLREIGVRSYLCVPLLSRGRVVGGMTFLSSSTRRRFGEDELRVAENLAERVATAIENAQLYRELQEQDRRKDEFLATLAHELRNPLAPIRNGLQILRMAGADGEIVGQTLTMMDRQLGHITHLVDDLMDMARVSSGKVVLRVEPSPLKPLIDAAVETSRQMIEAAKHEFTLRTPGEPLTVAADRTRLVQILANLLNNAAKYTPPGGRIEMSAERDGAFAAIRIADNGVGISSDLLPKVFEMFNQVGASLDRSQGGLGIGLTLVRRLVEMHEGTVEAESPGEGLGSVFTVRIPLAVEEGAAQEDAVASTDSATAQAFEILVVDDNRDSASSLAMLLTIRGHRVKTAHDGPEALRLLSHYRPRLILLDLGLPGMSGYEVAHRIRESTELRDTTLAALTGWGQAEDRRRTREAGFDHHLVKPAEPSEIDRIVADLAARK